MQTAEQWGDAEDRPESYWAALGKLLAVGILLAPLVMLGFPELNHRSGSTSSGRQDLRSEQAPTPDPVLIPEPFGRSDK